MGVESSALIVEATVFVSGGSSAKKFPAGRTKTVFSPKILPLIEGEKSKPERKIVRTKIKGDSPKKSRQSKSFFIIFVTNYRSIFPPFCQAKKCAKIWGIWRDYRKRKNPGEPAKISRFPGLKLKSFSKKRPPKLKTSNSTAQGTEVKIFS